MAERLNLLAWAMLIIGYLGKWYWLAFLGLFFLLLFVVIRRIYLPFPNVIFRFFSALSFLGVGGGLAQYLYLPTQDNLYLAIALWLLAALYDLLTEVYYGK